MAHCTPQRAVGILALGVLLVGCMPAVTHGPVVQEGVAFGGQFAVGAGDFISNGDYPDILPPTMLFARRGWAADSARSWGAHVGAQISPFVVMFGLGSEEDRRDVLSVLQGNAFVQMPGENPHGAGVTASGNGFMTYYQYGEVKPAGDSWYTTQGAGYISAGDDSFVIFSPSIAFRELGLRGRHAAHYQLGGVAGFALGNRSGPPIWMVTAGLVIELNGGTATPDD